MSPLAVTLPSLSTAMDGGFTAIHDVSSALSAVGAADEYRLIGGVSVMLHVQRLELDLPLRATGDADFGVPPHVLRRPDLVEAIGYRKVLGYRWERRLDDRRVAAVDLQIPTYRTRARDTGEVGDVVTTEVPGLAEALRRPGIRLDAQLRLTNGSSLSVNVVIPDPVGTIAMKTLVRSARNDARDVDDLWRCLEVAAAEGVQPSDFDDPSLHRVRDELWRQSAPAELHCLRLRVTSNPRLPCGSAREYARYSAKSSELMRTEIRERPDIQPWSAFQDRIAR